ncbi:type III-A CRISPR-associated protein Csm2 [Thermovibrio sp.]
MPMSKLCNRILAFGKDFLEELSNDLDLLLEILDKALNSSNKEELYQRYREITESIKAKAGDCIGSLPNLTREKFENKKVLENSRKKVEDLKKNLRKFKENCLILSCLFLLRQENRYKFFSLLSNEELYRPGFYVYRLSYDLRSSLKATQLRKFFNLIKKIETDIKHLKGTNPDKLQDILKSILRMYPLIYYSEARNLIPKPFLKILVAFLNRAEDELEKVKQEGKPLNECLSELRKFIEFMNSLVAYHKYFNPKD